MLRFIFREFGKKSCAGDGVGFFAFLLVFLRGFGKKWVLENVVF
jgi:hypothetical protein